MNHSHSEPPPSRRRFLQWATHFLNSLFGAVLGIPAVAYLIDARNRPAPLGDFRPAARLSELQIGVPHQAVLRDVRRDAWTLHPSDIIGRVWLIRRDATRVDAFTTSCPHLGCSINFEDAASPAERLFVCPCHRGTWNTQGERVEQPGRINPAPRGMDSLEVQFMPDDDRKDGLIMVRYQNFIQGKEVAVPRT